MSDFTDGFFNTSTQMSDNLKSRLSCCFDKEKEIKGSIKTRTAFEQRKEHIRKYFIETIGGLDIPRTPLNVVCTGILERNGYVIKKIIFQSQPGVYVTANLYQPSVIIGKLPGILFACGHFESGKAAGEYQKVCIDLVRNGFITLCMDPVGQGERMQYYDKELGRPLVCWGVTEHSYAGFQCTLTGSSIARYFIWDLIRALDFMCSLPEIDSGRIGITGNSGGGMQTAYMMLADERIKAAMPCTWISSVDAFSKTGNCQDSEQFIFGSVSEGLNHDDYISCFAPRLVLIGAAESDFFCIEGTVQSYERAKRIYALYGKEENIKLFTAKGGHCYSDSLRQAAVRWFEKCFKGVDSEFITSTHISVEDPEVLDCTESGQIMAEFEDSRSIYDLNLEYMKANRYKDTEDVNSIRKSITDTLSMPREKKKLYPRYSAERTSGCIYCESNSVLYKDVFFFSEEGIAVDGLYIQMAERKSGYCTILILEGGLGSYPVETDLIRCLLKRGDVFVFEPRGVGTLKGREVNSRPYDELFGTEYKLNCDAGTIGTSLTALRVFDVLRAVEFITKIEGKEKAALAGKGTGALYALLAAAVCDDVQEVFLENMLNSFEGLVSKKYFIYDSRYEIYGVMKKFDLPQIIKAFGKQKKIVTINTPYLGESIRMRAF